MIFIKIYIYKNISYIKHNKLKMPNYTDNSLVIRGNPKILKYFYERNRVTEEDVEILGSDEYFETDLSFEKSVSRITEDSVTDYIKKYYIPKNLDKIEEVEKQNDFMSTIFESIVNRQIRLIYWGTKSDAIEPTAYLEDIENHTIKYTFDTAWTPPNMWLIYVSKIYKNLEFVNTYSLEEEYHDMKYEYSYKNGVESEIRKYRLSDIEIEEYGIKKLLQEIFVILEKNTYNFEESEENKDKEKYNFKTFCTKFIEKNDINELFSYLYENNNELSDFFESNFDSYIKYNELLNNCFIDIMKLENIVSYSQLFE